MTQLLQYKCPCCDGAIEFDSTAQKMKCPYCDTEFEPETLISYDEELKERKADHMQWDTQAGREWDTGEEDGLRLYRCNSCGGEIVGDETLGATSCPFCSNPVIIMGQFAGDLKPDLVIPFKLDKKAALEALNKHYMNKKLLPKAFKDKNHLNEIKGVYVPFWLFDADADAHLNYRATRVKVWSDSKYTYTKTSFYSVTRGGEIGFSAVPVDGSSKIDDTLMESIEPFDLSEAVDFQTAYLSGYLADKYDVSNEESMGRANDRIKKTTEDAFADTVTGYNTVTPSHSSISLKNSAAHYALYPVWLLNTSYEGKNYTFAMNGQTGKFVGDLPLDKKAYRKWLFAIWGISAAAIFLVSILLGLL